MVRRVLVADDSAVARLAVTRRLRVMGVDVVERASAAEASVVDPADLACALLDFDLGDGDGDAVAAQLRARAPTLSVAFFTTTTDAETLARAGAHGPVFAKPGEIEAAVAWVIERVEAAKAEA